jgi:fucose 4-O-acetylase-like acetyltransferase
MKGIAILLMILGHSLPPSKTGNYLHGFIYSFHMPLFFVISGIFYKPRTTMMQAKKDFNTLILPYLFTSCVLIIYGLVIDLYGNVSFPNETVKWFRICFYGSYNPGNLLGNWIGPVWFLLALFWCRVFFSSFLSDDKTRNIFYFIIIPTIVSYIFKFTYIPLYVLQGITASIFYYIGYLLKEYDILNKTQPALVVLTMTAAWIYCIFFSHIDMQSGYYDNFIINIIGALSGFYFIYLFAKFIERKLAMGNKLLTYTGKFSIIALVFHSLDYTLNPFNILITMIKAAQLLMLEHFYRYYIGVRFLYIFIILLAIPKIKIFRKVFSLDKNIFAA